MRGKTEEHSIPTPLDRTDRRILHLLQRDGRLSNVELAKKVNVSAATCHRRTQRLFGQGYIRAAVRFHRSASSGACSWSSASSLTDRRRRLVAYPAQYRNSGVMTSIVNYAGTVFQKDLWSNTAKIAEP